MTPHADDLDRLIATIDQYCRGLPQVYLDVGAGDGYDCEQIANRYPYCRCIAIDPVEDWICTWIERHRLVFGAKINPMMPFFVKPMGSGISSLYDRVPVQTIAKYDLPVTTLDAFCQERNLKVDAMKLDVEGAAWDVLVGAPYTLSTLKVLHVETEWLTLFKDQHLEPEVFSLLTAAGLTCIWTHRVEELGQGDSLWVRQ